MKKGFDTKRRYGRVGGVRGRHGRRQWKGHRFDAG
jgi:hypothetical protein